MASHPKVPGSSRDGAIDARSSDATGRQADEVKPHAARASETAKRRPAPKRGESGEVRGAMRDQTER